MVSDLWTVCSLLENTHTHKQTHTHTLSIYPNVLHCPSLWGPSNITIDFTFISFTHILFSPLFPHSPHLTFLFSLGCKWTLFLSDPKKEEQREKQREYTGTCWWCSAPLTPIKEGTKQMSELSGLSYTERPWLPLVAKLSTMIFPIGGGRK